LRKIGAETNLSELYIPGVAKLFFRWFPGLLSPSYLVGLHFIFAKEKLGI